MAPFKIEKELRIVLKRINDPRSRQVRSLVNERVLRVVLERLPIATNESVAPREERVVSNIKDANCHVASILNNKRQLKVNIERLNLSSSQIVKRKPKRRATCSDYNRRRLSGLRSTNRQISQAAAATITTTTTEEIRRELVVRIQPLRTEDVENVPINTGHISPVLIPAAPAIQRELVVRIRPLPIEDGRNVIATPRTIASPPTTPVAVAVPNPVPQRAPAVVPPRRRHALVPRRVTYHKGVGTSEEDLERLCDVPFSCGALTDLCRYCGAKFFTKEPKNRSGIRIMCCNNNTVDIPAVRCPPELKPLYTENTPRGNEFFANIRVLNSTFAMASFKTSSPNPTAVEGQGHWSFSVCGQIYHFTVGVPTSQDLQNPLLSHYYFLDAEEVIDRRNSMLEARTNTDTVNLLERVLRRHHKYIRAFRTMGEVLQEEAERRGSRPVDDVIIAFSATGNMNQQRRQFNLPESRSEVAAVFYGTEPPFFVDLKLYPRQGVRDDGVNYERHHEIKNLNAMCDPMVYPLLFPFGEDGCGYQILHGPQKITLKKFYRYRIMIRDYFNLIHNGGKLFQQYLVDAWVRVETNDLWYIRQNIQDKLRIAKKNALRRAGLDPQQDANRVGRTVILPANFVGGPRNMQRLYLDSMNIVARHGKPDLFITFTCNPRWSEISDNLEFRQKPENRPDLVCRVFKIKLHEFLDDVVHKQIYGVVLNYFYVIEFQKRGLPHAHILVTFIPDDKIRSTEQIDEIISAVIPDKDRQPNLYELVGKYQVHSPCGTLNPNAACINEEGRCRKFYPKNYSNETIMRDPINHRPVYRRPEDNRRIALPNGGFVSNTRIVPYNPYSLAKFQTHINFEVVGTIETLKYLFKYVTKGVDYVTIFEDRVDIDEVQNYVDCRYVSSMEAAWRLLDFPLHDRSHSVLCLPVHLPGEEAICYEEDDTIEEIENRLEVKSKLLAWFDLNRTDVEARQYRYVEIPEHYVWIGKTGNWRARRQRSKMIGCLADVSPRTENLELFYLRLVLSHVRGATSYEALRTVNGTARDTFEETCSALDLLDTTDEYDLCLREAAFMRHPRQMRRLFGLIVCILTEETVAQVPELWRKYRRNMIEDLLHRGVSRVDAIRLCIENIDDVISRNRPGVSCASLGINVNDIDDDDEEDADVPSSPPAPSMEGEGNANERDGVVDAPQHPRYDPRSLNAEQHHLFVRIIEAVCRVAGKNVPNGLRRDVTDADDQIRNQRERLFFVDGPGGTGKTYLYNTLIKYVTEVLQIAVVSVAWTGIAANLLIGGRTVHRAFKMPITLTSESSAGWPMEHRESEFFQRVGLILWDEAPMTHRYAVEAVDRYLREVNVNGWGVPLGGKCIVFGGDFRQVLPVVPHSHRAVVIDACLKRLYFWKELSLLRLTKNVRAGGCANEQNVALERYEELGDMTFSEWLLAIGEGRIPHASLPDIRSLPPDLIAIPPIFHTTSLEELISFVYPDGDFLANDIGDRAILCPTNASVHTVNDSILDCLQGEIRTYFSKTAVKAQSEDEIEIPLELLNSINVAGLPPHELQLKVGAIVMLLRNLDVESGECNGARMRITHLGDHLIEAELVSGQSKGRRILLPKIQMIARDSMIPQEIVRTQFPVRVAYAMTINKAQGQTLKKVGVFLERSCFSHGQLYVALSRVSRPENIRVFIQDGLKQGSLKRTGKKFTRNVVYHSLLKENVNVNEEEHVPGRIRRRRSITPTEGVMADETELDEMFGRDSYDEIFENINISEIADNDFRFNNISNDNDEEDGCEDECNDPYVDNSGVDRRIDFAPCRSPNVLLNRISVYDQPGTSGLGVNLEEASPTRPSFYHLPHIVRRHDSDSSD